MGSYTYDTLNRMSTLANSWAGSFGFSYDALSRRTQMTRPNGVDTSYGYDKLSHLLSALHQLSGSTIDGEAYTLDPAGNRSTKQDDLAGVTSSYTYDKIYELTQVTQGANTTESYSYDPVGNRTASLAIPSYTVNTSNEITSDSSASYTYDNNGNTTSKTNSSGTTNYSWDYENRLSSVTLPNNGGTVQFRYDPVGRRIEKISPTATSIFVYDGDNLVETVNGSGGEVASYAEGLDLQDVDEPLAMDRSGTVDYYEQDGLNSVTSLTASNGSLAQSYTYDSFGNQTASSGSLTNFLRYTGREFDTETGLYYLRARYLDPTTGRFLSEDPLGVQDNIDMYVYVGNNAATYQDPWGLYTLKGFTPDQQVQMNNAINDAISKLRASCPSCAGSDGPKIANAIQGATFVYKPNMKPTLCGETGPLSFLGLRHVVSLGPNAFTPKCCSLASTIAHEATHLTGGNENKAQGVEKACFGCGN